MVIRNHLMYIEPLEVASVRSVSPFPITAAKRLLWRVAEATERAGPNTISPLLVFASKLKLTGTPSSRVVMFPLEVSNNQFETSNGNITTLLEGVVMFPLEVSN